MPPSPLATRKRPRQSRSRATVDALVTATTRVVRRDGYERATTNHIAEVAGVSIGSLYQYFSCKESLVAHALERRIDHMNGVVARGLQELTPLCLPHGVRAMVRTVLEDNATDFAFRSQYYELVARLGLGDAHRRYRHLTAAGIRQYLEAHRTEQGREDLASASVVCMDLVDAFLRSAFDGFPERLSDAAFSDEVTGLVLDYLRAPGAAAPG